MLFRKFYLQGKGIGGGQSEWDFPEQNLQHYNWITCDRVNVSFSDFWHLWETMNYREESAHAKDTWKKPSGLNCRIPGPFICIRITSIVFWVVLQRMPPRENEVGYSAVAPKSRLLWTLRVSKGCVLERPQKDLDLYTNDLSVTLRGFFYPRHITANI